jgi:hypothetical protein
MEHGAGGDTSICWSREYHEASDAGVEVGKELPGGGRRQQWDPGGKALVSAFHCQLCLSVIFI